jgi:hypothetical protein
MDSVLPMEVRGKTRKRAKTALFATVEKSGPFKAALESLPGQ